MKKLKAIFFIVLILFANLNIHVYQNWCNGENIGYTINAKKFNFFKDSFPKKQTTSSLDKENCCKDVLIKSNESSLFSAEKSFQISPVVLTPIFTDFTLFYDILPEEKKVPPLYSKPPPQKVKLYQYYCHYTYYG